VGSIPTLGTNKINDLALLPSSISQTKKHQTYRVLTVFINKKCVLSLIGKASYQSGDPSAFADATNHLLQP
jgi:hypothetical protein